MGSLDTFLLIFASVFRSLPSLVLEAVAASSDEARVSHLQMQDSDHSARRMRRERASGIQENSGDTVLNSRRPDLLMNGFALGAWQRGRHEPGDEAVQRRTVLAPFEAGGLAPWTGAKGGRAKWLATIPDRRYARNKHYGSRDGDVPPTREAPRGQSAGSLV